MSGKRRNSVKHLPKPCRGSAGTELSRVTRTFTRGWWGRQGSNLRPRDYESPALTTELLPPGLVFCLAGLFNSIIALP
jgi:hypothetical protein